MKITVDTNVLIRGVIRDDKQQAAAAARVLEQAEVIAVTLPSLCEFVWVLSGLYRLPRPDIAKAIRTLIDSSQVVTDREAVEVGLALFEADGDFADGVIAHEGRRLGGDTFVSFDKQAVRLLQSSGMPARMA